MAKLQCRPKVTSVEEVCIGLDEKDTTLAKCFWVQGWSCIATVVEICRFAIEIEESRTTPQGR